MAAWTGLQLEQNQIGMGAVAVKDVAADVKVVGVPAEPMRKTGEPAG